MLTDQQLAQIMGNASQSQRRDCLEALNAAMQAHQIDRNLLRAAAFLAQLAHESGELRFMEEIWGPTDAQKRYEPPSDLAERLGNSQPGDGKRFKGRGPIQLTGRANYRKFGGLLELDLEEQPEQVARPEIGFQVAGLFWQRNNLNALADAGDFKGITRRINGGLNGQIEREQLFERARRVLAASFPAQAAPVRAGKPLPRAGDELLRGFESIAAAAASASPRRIRKKIAPDAAAGTAEAGERVLDARPDTLDFRDLMYVPTLIEVPTHVPLNEYHAFNVPILDQGREGACTGFGLATVANYLLLRRRVLPDPVPVSPRMFYALARRYDEWPGEDYSGSSARGAIKGWHKHGVCSEAEFPYRPGDRRRQSDGGLTEARTSSALQRPLGAYFRVNHKDLVAMHSAIAEVGVLYATCIVHAGWNAVEGDGLIVQSSEMTGGHAFAIVAYDEDGLWLQNSWGRNWGRGGFAKISYDDWLENGTDVWVARLGAPVRLQKLESIATAHSSAAAQSNAFSFKDLRPHIVSVGNNGMLKAGGDYGSTPQELAHIFDDDIPRVTERWGKPRILLYAHGGLVSERAAVQRLAEYRPRLLDGEVYPLAFIWRTDYWTAVANLLADALRRRRPEGLLDAAKDFMLDRLDDALEPLARELSGKTVWDEIKQNARAASLDGGAMVQVADHLKRLVRRLPKLEVHLVGHSAGSILLAPVAKLLGARGLTAKSCTLWAPACTVDQFNDDYLPALQRRLIERFALFTLSDRAEQEDHCARIYNKSLLYLVSHAFEKEMRIPWSSKHEGVPILGMQHWHSPALQAALQAVGADVVVAPNNEPDGSPNGSSASHHGDFDDDERTVMATFQRIAAASDGGSAGAGTLSQQAGLARSAVDAGASKAKRRQSSAKTTQAVVGVDDQAAGKRMFARSEASLRAQRQQLDSKTR